jgi:hypothetical protein
MHESMGWARVAQVPTARMMGTELTLRGSRVYVGRLRLCTFSVRLRGIIYPRARRAAIVRTAMGVQ